MTSTAYSIRVVGDDCGALARLRRQWNDPSGQHDGDAAFETTFANWWATEKHTRRAYVAYSRASISPPPPDAAKIPETQFRGGHASRTRP